MYLPLALSVFSSLLPFVSALHGHLSQIDLSNRGKFPLIFIYLLFLLTRKQLCSVKITYSVNCREQQISCLISEWQRPDSQQSGAVRACCPCYSPVCRSYFHLKTGTGTTFSILANQITQSSKYLACLF